MLIDRYLSKAIFIGVAMSTLIFGGLFFFIDFVRELKHIGEADYSGLVALYYVSLNLPQRLYELAPSIILVGSLVSLGGLASNSEIVVLRTSGMSTNRLVGSLSSAGIVLALLVGLLGEVIAPASTAHAESVRAKALQHVLVGGRLGMWSRDGDRYINVDKVLPDKQLKGVTIYAFDASGSLRYTLHAEHADRKPDGWALRDVRRMSLGVAGVTNTYMDELSVENLVRDELFEVLDQEPEDMSAKDLYQYSRYLESNELDSDQYRLQFWVRVFAPITCMVMLILAVPLVLRADNRSGGLGQRIFIGFTIGVAFFVFNRVVNHSGLIYGIPPFLSALFPPMIVLSLIVFQMRRV